MTATQFEELNFSKICRICCAEAGANLMSIFKVHMYKKLMACCSIQVSRNNKITIN